MRNWKDEIEFAEDDGGFYYPEDYCDDYGREFYDYDDYDDYDYEDDITNYHEWWEPETDYGVF